MAHWKSSGLAILAALSLLGEITRGQLVNSFCKLSSDFARLENAQRLLAERGVSRLPFPIRPYDGFFAKKIRRRRAMD
jgi:hypothetical protein